MKLGLTLIAAVMLGTSGLASAQSWDGGRAQPALPGFASIKYQINQAPSVQAVAVVKTDAASPVLAKVTVCPANQNLLKSETVTVTKDKITFDVVRGAWSVQAGGPQTASLSYDVLSITPVGLLKRGLEVKYKGHDSAGDTFETLRVYSDSTNDINNGDLSAGNCAASTK